MKPGTCTNSSTHDVSVGWEGPHIRPQGSPKSQWAFCSRDRRALVSVRRMKANQLHTHSLLPSLLLWSLSFCSCSCADVAAPEHGLMVCESAYRLGGSGLGLKGGAHRAATNWSIGGSVVEFSPATREARVRFPAHATARSSFGAEPSLSRHLPVPPQLLLPHQQPTAPPPPPPSTHPLLLQANPTLSRTPPSHLSHWPLSLLFNFKKSVLALPYPVRFRCSPE